MAIDCNQRKSHLLNWKMKWKWERSKKKKSIRKWFSFTESVIRICCSLLDTWMICGQQIKNTITLVDWMGKLKINKIKKYRRLHQIGALDLYTCNRNKTMDSVVLLWFWINFITISESADARRCTNSIQRFRLCARLWVPMVVWHSCKWPDVEIAARCTPRYFSRFFICPFPCVCLPIYRQY